MTRLSHIEKQQKRRELKLKGFTPEKVEIEIKKLVNNTMEENTPVAPEATPEVETPEVAPETTSETTGTEPTPETSEPTSSVPV